MTKLMEILVCVYIGVLIRNIYDQIMSKDDSADDENGYGNCGDQHCEGCSDCDCDDDEDEYELSDKEMDNIAEKVVIKMTELDRQCK